MARQREYGEIPGYPEGTEFTNRKELADAGVHRPLQGGISGGKDGADSIVVSGGYPDDEDFGNEIIYTGQGGRDPATGKQVRDQELVLGNIGLVRSRLDNRLVRVIRGAHKGSEHAPERGYRYDGLFWVDDHWHDIGRDGYRIWRFRLVKLVLDSDSARRSVPASTRRTESVSSRIVRDRTVAEQVKAWHDSACQVCGTRLQTVAGAYAEGAHIQGLGQPHNGPDDESNMLCLCPNHHVLFDSGAIHIDDNFVIWDSIEQTRIGPLRRVSEHRIGLDFLRYHRQHYASPQDRAS